MAELVKQLWNGYTILFEELPDPRTKGLFLVAKPYQVTTILFLYLMFIFKWGPKWMERREPFNLRKVILTYNAVQVLACSYIFINAIRYGWGWKYRWVCEPVDYSYEHDALQIAHLVYYYYLTKVIDLADTIFFILRKKFNHVSFLHVYHHTGMVLLIWGGATYYPGGHGTLIGVINSFVHVIMYSYYFLTVAVPNTKHTAWWKKYITQLQILQFLLDVIHMSMLVFKSDCEYPRWTAALFLPQNIFMLLLFVDFYIKTYVRKPKAVKSHLKTPEQVDEANITSQKVKLEVSNVFEASVKRRKDGVKVEGNGASRT